MKKIIVLLALMLLLASTFSLMAAPATEAVDVIETRYKNLFVFKAERKYLGARVEVVSMSGDVVTAQRLHRRKMIIDFCDVKFGEYTIRIVKGDQQQVFTYVKK